MSRLAQLTMFFIFIVDFVLSFCLFCWFLLTFASVKCWLKALYIVALRIVYRLRQKGKCLIPAQAVLCGLRAWEDVGLLPVLTSLTMDMRHNNPVVSQRRGQVTCRTIFQLCRKEPAIGKITHHHHHQQLCLDFCKILSCDMWNYSQ